MSRPENGNRNEKKRGKGATAKEREKTRETTKGKTRKKPPKRRLVAWRGRTPGRARPSANAPFSPRAERLKPDSRSVGCAWTDSRQKKAPESPPKRGPAYSGAAGKRRRARLRASARAIAEARAKTRPNREPGPIRFVPRTPSARGPRRGGRQIWDFPRGNTASRASLGSNRERKRRERSAKPLGCLFGA